MLALLALLSGACEEEPTPGFEDGSFGAAHRAEIENDCDRRIRCEQRTEMYLRSDVFDICISENAQNLNALEEFRFNWQLGIMRCNYQQDDCAYRGCVDGGFESWGQSQRPKIENGCVQKRDCAIQNGTLGVAPQQYFESCRLAGVISADSLPQDARTTYTNAYFMCETLTGCAFQMCFPY